MSDMMTFPATVEEFMEQYKIVDDENVYTNGADLVPIFRMMQWFEHVSATNKNVGTTDTINRQRAIDAVTDELDMIDHVPQWVFDRLEGRLKQLPPVAPKQPDCAKCKSELANKIRGQQDNPGMLTENDKGRNWGLEWAAQIVEGKRR